MRRLLLCAVAAFMFASPAMAEEKDAPINVDGAKTVSPAEAKKLFDEGAFFIDVRETAAYEMGRAAGAIHLDVMTNAFTQEALEAEVKPADKKVFYCNGIKCGRSALAITKAKGWGHTNMYYLREGFPGWKASDYPTE